MVAMSKHMRLYFEIKSSTGVLGNKTMWRWRRQELLQVMIACSVLTNGTYSRPQKKYCLVVHRLDICGSLMFGVHSSLRRTAGRMRGKACL